MEKLFIGPVGVNGGSSSSLPPSVSQVPCTRLPSIGEDDGQVGCVFFWGAAAGDCDGEETDRHSNGFGLWQPCRVGK